MGTESEDFFFFFFLRNDISSTDMKFLRVSFSFFLFSFFLFFFLYLQSREKWEIHVGLLVFPASDVGSLDKLSAEQGGEEIRVQR